MTKTKGQQATNSLLPISKISTNTGQVPGLPRNPRVIRDTRFQKLKQSISDFPDMLELREIVVFPYRGRFVCIGGNQRFLACKDLGYKEIPAKVLPKNYPIERLREFAIKDNRGFGDDDIDALNAEWQDLPLSDWGIDLPAIPEIDLDDFFVENEPAVITEKYSIILEYQKEKERDAVLQALSAHGETPAIAIQVLLSL